MLLLIVFCLWYSLVCSNWWIYDLKKGNYKNPKKVVKLHIVVSIIAMLAALTVGSILRGYIINFW